MSIIKRGGNINIVQSTANDVLVSNRQSQFRKVCAHCGKPIKQGNESNKKTLKALGKYYHEECFLCYDCSVPLKPKYFPYKDRNDTILLCQYHYFSRHNLLCKVCDKPLRGLYYTAFGGRYDEEHFCCSICKTPCGVKKCFMHNNQLYCKYHFLKYFSKHCQGCDYPISDQYIEFPKGEEIHCWHPECYGIHKYWHVNLSSEALGIPSLPTVQYDSSTNDDTVSPTSLELEKQIKAFNFILTKTWSVLYHFEEETASCISDMFQYLSSYEQIKGLESAALFVLKISCLFRALDQFPLFNTFIDDKTRKHKLNLEPSMFDGESNKYKTKYSKFPRNLTTKVMIYLQLLRKLSAEAQSGNSSLASFMSVITGLAHFLKLLIRYGLFASLEIGRSQHSISVLLKFLKEIEKNENYTKKPFSFINIPVTATDACTGCNKYIQEECVQFQDLRWHLQCFFCSACKKKISYNDIDDATFNRKNSGILCFDCSVNDVESIIGFKLVTRLSQLIYLLQIALVRSRTVMIAHINSSDVFKLENDRRKSMTMQQSYIRTLNDIKRLRSRRESVRINQNEQDASKSKVLEIPESDFSKVHEMNEKDLIIENENSSTIANDDLPHENVFNSTKTLTLDDISRIVAAEQARELRPNAFTHFKKIKEADEEILTAIPKRSGTYFSELSLDEMCVLRAISTAFLKIEGGKIFGSIDLPNIPKTLLSQDKPSSNKFWYKMRTVMGIDTKKEQPNKVFGTSLSTVSEKWGIDSDLGVGPSKIRIPIVIDELISSLRSKDMSVEGIFRKNGNIRRLRELTDIVNNNPKATPDLSKENVIQLSALLKKYIRELPDPLLTESLYDLWISAAKIDSDIEKDKFISLIYSLLPVYNRNLLEVLLSFLCWTSSFSHIDNEMGSKMDIHNLSTVIAPNILYVPHKTDSDLQPTNAYADNFAQHEGQHHFLAIEIIDYLVTYNEEIAMVPHFLNNLLKDIMSGGIESYDKIHDYVATKIEQGDIDYSEFERKNTVKIQTSVTTVIKGDNDNRKSKNMISNGN